MNARRGPQPDPLLDIFLALRDAFAPLGGRLDAAAFKLWQEAQARRTTIFVGSGEFDPVLVGALEDAVAMMRASTADVPGEDRHSNG